MPDAKVEKRPIPHAPVASPYAGSSVPKIVYVASKTPFMSAVKRVQKLLRQAEKRATAGVSLEDTQTTEKQKLAALAKAAETREEIFVKATGKAIEKALNVGKWFEEKEAEYAVRVITGSVLVVDDVVEDEEKKEAELRKQQRQAKAPADGKKDSANKRKREVANESDHEELPETRTRWIKKVEVAISFK
jgi:ribonuclease P/MRP protein subunit POP7